jgi:hypothetical protein
MRVRVAGQRIAWRRERELLDAGERVGLRDAEDRCRPEEDSRLIVTLTVG